MPGELPFPTPDLHEHPHDAKSPDSLPDQKADILPDLDDKLNPDNYARDAENTAIEIARLSTFLNDIGEETTNLTLEQMRGLIQTVRDERLIPHYINRARVMSPETKALLKRNGYPDVENMGAIKRAQAIKASEAAEAAIAAMPTPRTPPPPHPRREAS